MRRTMLIGLALTLASCGQNEVADPGPSTIVGSYSLTTVDGHDLPFTVLDLGGYRTQLVSGMLALRSDGSYSLAIDRRTIDGGRVTTATDGDAGRWTLAGDSLALASTQGGIPRTGSVAGDAITLQSSIRRFVLRR
jgi:hypothetical protein